MADEKITKQDIEKAKEKLKEKKAEKTITIKESSEEKSSPSKKEQKIIYKEQEDKEKEEKKGDMEVAKPLAKEKPVEKKKERKERIGILNIYTSFNNTIMNLTDLSGNSIAKFSGGQSTKQDRLKANPTIAMFVSQRIAEEAKDNGITGFYVKIRAKTGQNNPGPGAHSALKSLTRAGFKILSIMDTTRVARGGPKKKGGRRGRRP